ncbi:DUF4097 family beta strand repeat-containing protein [Anaerocolumna sp. MB42-C2]|uniref:DUF4097 family beta strand repeat-containing protein n=1 Tax=Anaerocolumna sp. MB42-C2 TaxID=3070997 RepID=UPI0027DFDB22|nr:DUF4097 family beta strand repeat-containing protein [Anaerocolumna sp. MB42-C2]WMJ87680.1 DUF4097 family beta strand repeat-containing protein [Anaerocolumna sp. MB42-C2]
MKHNLLSFPCVVLLLVGFLSGCRIQKAISLVNTLTFNTVDFESLRLDYDADDIRVLKSNNDQLIVKEYMNENKQSFYARTFKQNGELLITEGDRPKRSGFDSYIEIYIPQNYTGNLSLHSTSGTIHSELALNLSGNFNVDTTSGLVEVSNTKALNVKASSTNGSLNFENMIADEVNIQTTNAATSLNKIIGTINYQSKGGKLTASALHGSGSFNASGEGSIEISFADVTRDISAYSKNGTLAVTLPRELAFKFSATTKEGSIDTSFTDRLIVTDNTTSGTVGTSPDITVELETRNGDIKVSR